MIDVSVLAKSWRAQAFVAVVCTLLFVIIVPWTWFNDAYEYRETRDDIAKIGNAEQPAEFDAAEVDYLLGFVVPALIALLMSAYHTWWHVINRRKVQLVWAVIALVLFTFAVICMAIAIRHDIFFATYIAQLDDGIGLRTQRPIDAQIGARVAKECYRHGLIVTLAIVCEALAGRPSATENQDDSSDP